MYRVLLRDSSEASKHLSALHFLATHGLVAAKGRYGYISSPPLPREDAEILYMLACDAGLCAIRQACAG